MGIDPQTVIQDNLHPFIASCHKEGLTFPYLAKKLKAELNAKKTDTFKAKTARYEDGGLVEREEVIYSKPMIDWKTRAQARKDALAYQGVIVTEKHEIGGFGGGPLSFTVVYDDPPKKDGSNGNGNGGPSD